MALRMWVPAGQRAHDTDAHHVRRPGVLVDAHARRRVPARQTAQVDSRDGAGAWDCFSSVICRHPSKPGTLRALRVRRLRQNTHRAARDGRPLGPTARSRDVRLVDGSRLGRHAPARLARRAGFSLPRVASRVVVLPPVAFRSRRRARGPGSASATLPPRRRAPPSLASLPDDDAPDASPRAPASSDPDATPTVSSSSDADPVPVPPRGGVVGWWRAYAAKSASMAAQIRAYGLAGLTAYGILNTVYYTVAFTAAWSFRSVPDASTTGAAFRAAGEVMALVWAGSQVTKLARFGIAIAAAPKIDGFIRAWCERSGWGYRRTFVTVTVGCFLGSAAFFAALIVAKAAST